MKNKNVYIILVLVLFVAGYFFMKPKAAPSINLNPSQKPASTTTPVISENILQIIPTLTTPMVWSKPVEGTLMNAAGDEVPGTIISSKVATKEANKFAGLLVTDTPIVKEYGWVEDLSGIADGMGESIHTYTKNNQSLIIRYKGGEYKVLLSK
jgi:hypothetical protein